VSAAPSSAARTVDRWEAADPPSELGPVGLLLRDPAEVAKRCVEEDRLRPLGAASLGAIAIGTAAFGAVVGSFRGGEQIAYAAVKMPLAFLGALVVCVPAFHAIASALGRPWPLRTVVALAVASAGRAALVLCALAPVLWLAMDLGLGYHASALAATLTYGLAGAAALGILLRGLGEAKHRVTTALAFALVFLAAGAQTGWLLRPYLVRPRSEEVPFVRSLEGGVADALASSARSAIGIYDRARAPTPEDWERNTSGEY
jgi:hypothetical protein